MTSPNNMQSLALTNSEKEPPRNSTLNTDDEDDEDDEMPVITNAMYIAELKQRHAQQIDDLDERNDRRIVDLNQRNIDLKEQIANLQKQHYNHMYFTMLSVFIAILLTYIFNAKTVCDLYTLTMIRHYGITEFTIPNEGSGYEWMNSNGFMADGEFALRNTQIWSYGWHKGNLYLFQHVSSGVMSGW
ncbi:uncharacterized protein EAE97_004420 [Botrytis byssoidea]|uniref:Uncharacterized protein n=1 Tax=Botrytis byssoidea TaxID=139641 RepID=A0A9P5ISX8_9HELO|nr:uncharacterized protein EAE97_004420 [Botrytis byssoidea]KAF7947171.1 hypothetical protein EAE97_004420 [Botrytis byssoidea]